MIILKNGFPIFVVSKGQCEVKIGNYLQHTVITLEIIRNCEIKLGCC